MICWRSHLLVGFAGPDPATGFEILCMADGTGLAESVKAGEGWQVGSLIPAMIG
jgi:hypothetical protein